MSWSRPGAQFNATLDAEVLEEIRREAARQRRSVCALVRQAWKLAKAEIRAFPGAVERFEQRVIDGRAEVANDERSWVDPSSRWKEAVEYTGKRREAATWPKPKPVALAKPGRALTLKK